MAVWTGIEGIGRFRFIVDFYVCPTPGIVCECECKTIMTSEKEALYATLDSFISRKGLTDLHTHLMGMGSADFWVSRIMETYLPRIMNPDKPETDVFYPLSDVLRASGFESLTPFDKELDKSVFEARFFDGFDDGTSNYNLKSVFQLKSGVLCLANQSLIKMLRFEDAKFHRSGPLRALVRNWFQFLGSNGQPAHHSEVLQICKR